MLELENKENRSNHVDYDKILAERRIDTAKIIEKPPIILSIKEVSPSGVSMKRIFTLGNFSTIIGKSKSRKTFLQSLFLAAIIKGSDYHEILKGELPENKKLCIYIDTEQGQWDSYNTIKRIEKMAGIKDNFIAYNLRIYEPLERCNIIEHIFKIQGDKIGFCVIDGIADLAFGINDENEATRIASMLLRLSRNCHISIVIHQNKNDNFATGHLGSSVMKKSEIVISVNKFDKDKSCSEVKCDFNRGPDFEPFLIRINSYGYPEIAELRKTFPAKQNYYEVEKEQDMPPF